jgi:hypothetical protein
VTYFESHISEIAFPRQPIWKFLGNRFVEALIHGDIQAEETELVEIGVPVAVLGICISSKSSRELQFEWRCSSNYYKI